jgi:phthiodiolone/phenolphthiodiolone dimycocerosates ketoreductase
MGRLKIGGSASHLLTARAYAGVGSSIDSGKTAFEGSVESIVRLEKAGRDWAICADCTDNALPASAYTKDITSAYREDGYDWNAAFTMEPVIAAAAAQTERIKFVWGPIDPIRRAPVNIAQMALTLDHATKGRLTLLMAHGQQNHLRPYGIPRAGVKDKFWDAVQIVRKLMTTSDEFSYHGRMWTMQRAALALPPFGVRPPPLYLAGGGPETLELAGRFADGWHDCIPSMEEDDPRNFAEKIDTIRRHAEQHGRDPDAIAISVAIETVSSEDPLMLCRALEHPFVLWATGCIMPPSSAVFEKWGLVHPYGSNFNYYRDMIAEWIPRQEFDDVIRRMPREAVPRVFFTGNAHRVWARLEPYLVHGISEVRIINWAGLCGSEFLPGVQEASERLFQKLRNFK